MFKQMVRHAIDNGLNYIDTAYVYTGGKNEEITGRILGDVYRERFCGGRGLDGTSVAEQSV